MRRPGVMRRIRSKRVIGGVKHRRKPIIQARERRPGMSRGKWVVVFGVLAAAVLAIGANPATADILFGNLTPIAGGACAPPGPGAVGGGCNSANLTFSSGGDVVDVHGFSGAP